MIVIIVITMIDMMIVMMIIPIYKRLLGIVIDVKDVQVSNAFQPNDS